MTLGDLLWFPPLMLAVAVVVGTAGRRRGEIALAIRRTFVALVVGVVAVAAVVRLLVVFFA
jgi:hypothetical protein